VNRFLIIFLTFFYIAFAQSVKIEKIEFAVAIQDRNPIGTSDKFPADIGKIYCWTKVVAEKIPTKIYHVWYYGNREMARVELGIMYHTFRTWSSKKILPQWIGTWKVIVEDEEGNKVAEKSFEITDNW